MTSSGTCWPGLDASLAAGLHTKINFVLLAGCEGRVLPVAKLAQSRPVDVRFIEVMPIGAGAESRGLAPAEARKLLLAQWPDLHPVDEHRGNGRPTTTPAPGCWAASAGSRP